jgi:hypothetical protein
MRTLMSPALQRDPVRPLRKKGTRDMKSDRVRKALLDGYQITIDASTSEHPELHRHATFEHMWRFDEVLAEAHALLEDGCDVLRWTLRTDDGCIVYRARVLLAAAAPYFPLCRRLEEDCCAVLTNPPTDIAAAAVAKVMRFAANVLSSEAERAQTREAVRYVDRLLPHARVRRAATCA